MTLISTRLLLPRYHTIACVWRRGRGLNNRIMNDITFRTSKYLDLRPKQTHYYDYIVGTLTISAFFFLFAYALPAMFTPMSCTVSQHTQAVICQ